METQINIRDARGRVLKGLFCWRRISELQNCEEILRKHLVWCDVVCCGVVCMSVWCGVVCVCVRV